MRTEPAEVRTGGAHIHSPMQVAQHPLFTPQEKIEMLAEVRESNRERKTRERGYS